MELKDAVKEVLGKIESGYVFDTHTVIDYLLQDKSDVYLHSCRNRETELYHGYISQVIGEFSEVERIGDSWSKTIHDTFRKCACWKKLN